MRPALALALLISTLGCFRVTNGYGLAPAWNLDVAGPGAFTNLGANEQANTNAVAHTFAALAIPLLGEHVAGRKGLWYAGLGWVAYTLIEEGMYHCPASAGICHSPAGYPAEVRTDLLTRIVPTLVLLGVDLALHWREP